MIDCSEEYLQAINSYDRSMRTRIHFEELNITVEEQIKSCNIEQMGFSGEKITLGDYCSNKVTVIIDKSIEEEHNTIIDIDYSVGMTFYIEHGIEINGNLEFKKLGYFTISNIDENEYSPKITITAFDCVSKLNAKYIPSIGAPTDSKKVLEDIEKQCGIKFNIPFYGSGNGFRVHKFFDVSCAEMVSYIANWHGANFRASTNKNEIEFYKYKDSGFVIDENNLLQGSLVVKVDKDIKITSIKVGSGEIFNDVNGEPEPEQRYITVGSGYGMTFISPYINHSQLNSLLDNFKDFSYRPLTLNYRGNPCLQAGDIVTVIGKYGTYKAILSSHSLNLLGMSGTIESKGVSETEESLNTLSPTDRKIEEAQRIMLQYVAKQYVTLQYVDTQYVTKQYVEESIIKDLNALSGKIDDLDVGNLEATYAKIDLSNVTTEHVSNLFVKTGLLENATITDGHITGTLTGVKITGDLIEANTLAVKDLLLEGEDGLIYQINALASGLTQTELSKEIYQQKLNGTDIVANSITATQIAGNTITADKINVADLFAQDITATGTITGLALKGGSININDVFIVNSIGEVTATSGTFTGIVNATGGMFNNVEANNLTVNTGTFKGVVNTEQDVYVGNNIYLGDQNNFNKNKYIYLNKSNYINFYTSSANNSFIHMLSSYNGNASEFTLAHDLIHLTTAGRILLYGNNAEVDIGEVDGVVSVGNTLKIEETLLNSNSIRLNGLLLSDVVTSGNRMSVGYGAYEHGLSLNIYGAPIKLRSFNTIQVNTEQPIGLYSNNGIAIANNSSFWGKNTSGTNKQLIGISSGNNLFIGSSESGNSTGDTNIYSGNHIYFYANRLSNSYKASGIDLFREQSGSYRTVFRPASDNGAYAGTASFRWNTVFSTNGVKTSSDIKQKNIIKDFDFKVQDFIMGLEPIAFRRTGEGNTGKRIHLGLGAQDVNKLIKDIKLGDMSLVQACIVGGEEEKPYFGEDIDDSKLVWSLNYGELIAPVILMEQDHEYRIQQLEKENMYLRQVLRDNNLLGGTI